MGTAMHARMIPAGAWLLANKGSLRGGVQVCSASSTTHNTAIPAFIFTVRPAAVVFASTPLNL